MLVGDSLKHSIGNLALLKSMANSKEGNKLPDAKIVSYEESWVFNRALCDEPKADDQVLLAEIRRIQESVSANLTEWDEQAIERRRDFIADEFQRLMVDWLKRLEVYG